MVFSSLLVLTKLPVDMTLNENNKKKYIDAIVGLAGMRLEPIVFKPTKQPERFAECRFYDGTPEDFDRCIRELAYDVCSKKWPAGTTFMNPKLTFQFTLNRYEVCAMFTIDVIERPEVMGDILAFVFVAVEGANKIPEDVAREVCKFIGYITK